MTARAHQARVYKLNGALVKTQTVPAGETFIDGLTRGVYMVRLTDGTAAKVNIH